MKILLIMPPFKCFTGLYSYGFPMGLTILASIASEEGFEVSVCEIDKFKPAEDLNLSDEYSALNRYISSVNDPDHPVWRELKNKLSLFNPDIVGITVYTTTFASSMRTAEICKAHNPHVVTILGGPHVTARPYDCLKKDYVDFIVVGEGEISFRRLLKSLVTKSAATDAIPGLGYRENGKIRINPKPDFIKNLDDVPIARRDFLMYQDKYSPIDMGLLMVSRGCPFDCTYCFHFWGKAIRYRSVESVIKEIEAIKDKYGVNHFAFKDDSLTLNSKWVLELCNELKRRQMEITWECTTRADMLDEKLLDAMILSGCNVIKIGIESGSPEVLGMTKKNISVETSLKAAKLLNSRKVFWSGYFMYGLPFEREEDLQATYKFMKALSPSYASLCLYQVSPTTELYNYGVENGIYLQDAPLEHFFKVNPKDYYMVNPDARSLRIRPERFREIERSLVKKFDNYNTSVARIFKRGWARRKIYIRKIPLLFKEARIALKWMIKNRMRRIKRVA